MTIVKNFLGILVIMCIVQTVESKTLSSDTNSKYFEHIAILPNGLLIVCTKFEPFIEQCEEWDTIADIVPNCTVPTTISFDQIGEHIGVVVEYQPITNCRG